MRMGYLLALVAALAALSPAPSGAAEVRRSKLPAAATEAIERARDFAVTIRRPDQASGDTFVLLHGSGGNEKALLPLAAKIAPHSVLIGLRGRVLQDGKQRWYRRITPTSFDQADIRTEAGALVEYLNGCVARGELDLARTTFVGYSNGANLIAAVSLLHPGLVRRAVLLRPMPVLDIAPLADLKQSSFLLVAGREDKIYGPFAPKLEAQLRERGATVEFQSIGNGHGIGDTDAKLAATWLDRVEAVALSR